MHSQTKSLETLHSWYNLFTRKLIMLRSVFSHVRLVIYVFYRLMWHTTGKHILNPTISVTRLMFVYIDHNQFKLYLIYVQSHRKTHSDGLFQSGMRQRLLHIIFTLTNGTYNALNQKPSWEDGLHMYCGEIYTPTKSWKSFNFILDYVCN